jgi:hypothetical protein
MIEKNVGGIDRQLRFLAGGLLVLAGLAAAAADIAGPTVALVALAGGVGLLVNAVTQRCLMNRLFGIDTCGENC